MQEVLEVSIGYGQLIQTKLMGETISLSVVWVFIGIFSAEKLGITLNELYKKIINKEILSAILS